jgi:transcription antitermination factor NusG
MNINRSGGFRLKSSPKLDPVDDMHREERKWFAVRTSARHEKRAATALQKRGVTAYLPLRERICHYPGKTVSRQLPLLPGYVFVWIKKEEEATVFHCPYVAGFVRLGRERRCVADDEIKLLRRISTDRSLSWEAVEDLYQMPSGTPVEIIRGPLAGFRGHYLRQKNKNTFVITFAGLNAHLATCEVDPHYLAALDGRPLGSERSSSGGDFEGRQTLW